MRFTNSEGVSRFGRYRINPNSGVEFLDDDATKALDPNFLFTELTNRIAQGPIGFQVAAQIAQPGDVVDDATNHWPEDRPQIELGKILLTALVPENASEQKKIIFDPIPRVEGIDPSDDPLLELRAAIYLISGRRRRQAPESQT